MSDYCMKCMKEYPGKILFEEKGIPKCSCGGIIRPKVVLYEESLPKEFDMAIDYISKADLLIVAGTSLTVFPASNLVNYFHGKHLVIINLDETSYDNRADLVINAPLKDVFSSLK